MHLTRIALADPCGHTHTGARSRARGRARVRSHIVHFGMAGEFATFKEGPYPAVKPTTRLVLEFENGVRAHLSAMTVVLDTVAALYEPKVAALGTDPLRADADPARFAAACASYGKKTIGALLLDQSKIAGVGNIYRSEMLAEAHIHPNEPASSLEGEVVDALWRVIVKQMRAGFESGSIWDPVTGPKVYGKTKSHLGGKVETWRVNGRSLYAGAHQKLGFPGAGANASAKATAKAGKRKGAALEAKEMVTAGDARATKRARGEKLNAQHTALKDDAVRDAEAAEAAASKRAPAKKPKAAKKKAPKAAKKKAPKAAKKKAPKRWMSAKKGRPAKKK